jgi:dipeptidyl aminopeptidase/acylaminoacyl peptidase
MLVFHGEKDNTVLPDQSKRIHDVYSATGLPITLITIKEAGHGGEEFHNEDNRRTMINFLKRHLLTRENTSNDNAEQGAEGDAVNRAP